MFCQYSPMSYPLSPRQRHNPAWYELSTVGVTSKDTYQHILMISTLRNAHNNLNVQKTLDTTKKTFYSLDTLTHKLYITTEYKTTNNFHVMTPWIA